MSIPSGSKLGPYEIVAPVGAGGMGEVYRARDQRLGRDVAIKVLPAALSRDAERLRRFEQEARAAAAINHPNILAVFDIGTHEDSPYLVTELLEGETLRERMEERALSPRKAIDYAQQIAHGLIAAHEKGILHRDLKPENIFVTSSGKVKILDFGLAKLMRPDGAGSPSETPTLVGTMGTATAAGIVLGTVGYMSPEQVRGLNVDARSDLFSLGAILYEMVSGRRAFGGDTPADTMSAILKEEPPALADIQPNVPPGLARIVEHCLEKNPADRFQSARDVAFALDAFSGSSSSKVAALPAAGGAGFWQRRTELIVAAAALAAIAAFLIGRSTLPLTSAPTYHQLTFQRGTIYQARFAPDGETVVYAAAWNGKPSELFSVRTDSTESRSLGLTDVDLGGISSTGDIAVRISPRYLTSFQTVGTVGRTALTGGIPRPLENGVQAGDWAPDGKSGVVVRDVGGEQRMEISGKVLYSTPGWISNPRFSPDGTKIAFVNHQSRAGDPGRISVINLGDGKVTDLVKDFVSSDGLAWPPAGDEVWFTASRTGSMRLLYGVTLNGKERIITSIPGILTLQDISKKGKVLLTQDVWRLEVLALAPGKDKEQNLSYQDYSAIRATSPDGKTLLFDESGEAGGAAGVMYLRPMDGSPPLRLGDGTSQALSPDGKWVMAVDVQGLNQVIIIPTGTGESRRLPHLPFYPHWGDFLPGGKELLVSGGEEGHSNRMYRVNAETGAVRPVTPEGVTPVPYAQIISPDGKSVLAFGPDGPGIYSTENGERKAIPGMEPGEQPIAWTGDGASIYVYRPTVPARVFRIDLTSGKRTLWKELSPVDPVGVFFIRPPHIAYDGKSYAYNYGRILSDLYVADGLK